MRKLASRIETELKAQEICAVYNSELARVWPKKISPEKRKKEIKRFADKHDLNVTFYDVGLCAVFEKAEAPARSLKPVLVLKRGKAKRSQKRRN
jgi:hypothetical protein